MLRISLRQTVMYLSKIIHGANFSGIEPPEPALYVRVLYTAVFALALYSLFTLIKRIARNNGNCSWTQIILLCVTAIPVFYLSNLGIMVGLDQGNLSPLTVLVGQTSSLCGLVIVMEFDRVLALGQKERDLARMEAMLGQSIRAVPPKKGNG